jgi:hypothetical protein
VNENVPTRHTCPPTERVNRHETIQRDTLGNPIDTNLLSTINKNAYW